MMHIISISPDALRSIDIYSNNALHLAVMAGFEEAIPILLKLGMDHYIPNKFGCSPLDIANKQDNHKIMSMLMLSNSKDSDMIDKNGEGHALSIQDPDDCAIYIEEGHAAPVYSRK